MFGKKRNLSEDAENTQTPYDSDSLGYEDGGMDYPEEEYAEDSVGRDTEETDGYDEYGENEGGDSADGEYYGEYYDEDDEYGDEDYEETPPKSVGRTVAYMLIVLLVSAGLAVVMWFAADDVLALTKPDNVITITIREGDTLDDVAQNLKDHGLINYKFLFKLYGTFSHAEEDISPGTFELNQQFDYHALVNGLADYSDTRKTVTLTFPEGYTCNQIFASLAENDVCTLEELENTAANYEFDYSFLENRPYGEANRLEGYLFPDTYDFYVDDTPERVINKLLSNFADKFTDEMMVAIDERNADIRARMEEEGTFTEEEIENSMLDVYKVLTVASLIEKEAGSDQERAMIASVIYNRLTTHVHELLQIDASVEYALGEHKGELTANDLAVDNPYNTYKYKGLPPGPIANPGLNSIMAALYPEDTEYFFYALDGSTHQFFETYMDQQDFLNGNVPADSEDEASADEEKPEDGEPAEDAEDGQEPYYQEPVAETGEEPGDEQ